MRTLRNVKRVELLGLPMVASCVLPNGFKCVEDVVMENASGFEGIHELMEVVVRKSEEEKKRRRAEDEKERERLKREEEKRQREEYKRMERDALATNEGAWDRIDTRVEYIDVSDNGFNGCDLNELYLSGFEHLKELGVGDDCFRNVKKVSICGLKELKRVVIGMRSFKRFNDTVDGSFCVKNCPRLRELKIDNDSFMDYTVCEIENTPALEVIDMEGTFSFRHAASLELKSILTHIGSRLDFPQLKSLRFGERAFNHCSRVVFESDSFAFI